MTRTVLCYGSFGGYRADGTWISGVIPQGDGSTFQWTNCGAASEAEIVVAQQKGRKPYRGTPWTPTGKSIRAETGDRSGGLTPSQTIAASTREYGISRAPVRIDNWSRVEWYLWNGYPVDLCVGYGPIDDTSLSGSPGFRGNHRLVLTGIRQLDSGAIQVRSADPLYDGRRSGIPRGARWISATTMRRAAGMLLIDGRKTLNTHSGYGKAYFTPSLTRTVPTTASYKVSVHPATGDTYHYFWVYTVVNGVITGRVRARTGGFSATCTAPQNYVWTGKGTYSLVKLTSGVRSGQYIASTYARKV